MRIGIAGSGNIGGTLALLLSRAGHEVPRPTGAAPRPSWPPSRSRSGG